MIIIRYHNKVKKELQDKVGYIHGELFYNGERHNIIERILKAGLNIKIIQKKQNIIPRQIYYIWIYDKSF